MLVPFVEGQYKVNMAKDITSARISVVGSHYTALPRAQVTQLILNHALARKGSYVCVSNVHTTMMGFWDPSYQAITNASLVSVPDGVPLVWAMRALGALQQDRVRGPSLMKDLCSVGTSLGLKHYLFGSTPETLARLKEKLLLQYSGIQIVGSESPPFRPLRREENEAVLERVEKSGAHILWVGLGAPKQERWIAENARAHGAVGIGIGAAFDLLAEKIPEAPGWMQRLGLEWLFRFFKEPRRLWRRYLYHNPSFVVLFAIQMIGYKYNSIMGKKHA